MNQRRLDERRLVDDLIREEKDDLWNVRGQDTMEQMGFYDGKMFDNRVNNTLKNDLLPKTLVLDEKDRAVDQALANTKRLGPQRASKGIYQQRKADLERDLTYADTCISQEIMTPVGETQRPLSSKRMVQMQADALLGDSKDVYDLGDPVKAKKETELPEDNPFNMARKAPKSTASLSANMLKMRNTSQVPDRPKVSDDLQDVSKLLELLGMDVQESPVKPEKKGLASLNERTTRSRASFVPKKAHK